MIGRRVRQAKRSYGRANATGPRRTRAQGRRTRTVRARAASAAAAGLALLLTGLLASGCDSGTGTDPGTESSPPVATTTATPTQSAGMLRGIFDDTWVNATADEQQAIVAQMADELHVQVVRIDLRWSLAEPEAAGQYDTAYLDRIRAAVDAARAKGMQVMIDVFGVPRWASDTSYWSSPPSEDFGTDYQPFYPVADSHLDEWQKSAAYFVTYMKGEVSWWECWNEPNLWQYIYPQKTSKDPRFAATCYMKLLKPFSKAVHGADESAQVLGGVTAPFGMDDTFRTSPQKFAQHLKSLGAAKYWDGYSHHPYMPAASSKLPGPREEPRFPEYTITLGNITTLLKIFPDEPFYLTEYGYATEASTSWGQGHVTEQEQAEYLKIAYDYAKGLKQVKMLTWFLWKDIYGGSPEDVSNAFFGLVRPDGTKKPSWQAYAGLR